MQERKGQVRKGERATTVVFWKFANSSAESQDDGVEHAVSSSRLLFTRGYSVFNASQVDGYTPKPDPDTPIEQRIESAEQFFSGINAGVGSGAGGGVAGGIMAFTPPVAASTSMLIAVEAKNVTQATNAYIRHLSKVVRNQPDAIGYVFAINGKLNSAEIYSSRELFMRMWPKLLKASAIEAIAERGKEQSSAGLDAKTIRLALADAEHGHATSKAVNHRLDVVMKETDKAVLFETRDREQGGEILHRSYIMK